MASKVITENDLTNILNEVLPPTPSEYKTLLWTNPNLSDFGSQTITLDLNQYDIVEIHTVQHTSRSTYEVPISVTEVGRGGDIYAITGASSDTGGAAAWSKRTYTTSTTGITFSGCYLSYDGQTWLSGYNAHLIPYKIYGIKYERVNPPQVEIEDVVIEQGTSGIWTYRKWNSGIAECWGISAQRTVTSWPTWGYINYGDPYTTYDTYPTGLFISTPVCEAQICGASADCWLVKGVVSNTATATNTPCFYLARGTAATGTVTYSIAYHAIGRWK